MPYAFLNPDGSIKQVFNKPSPFMRLGEGERMVNYNPPTVDHEVEDVGHILPIDGLDTKFKVTPKPPEVVAAVWQQRKTAVVQKHLDATAQAKGYDGILSAASYAGSKHRVYGPQGIAFRDWRDACWDYAFQVLTDVKTGKRQMPTDEQLLSELPAFMG